MFRSELAKSGSTQWPIERLRLGDRISFRLGAWVGMMLASFVFVSQPARAAAFSPGYWVSAQHQIVLQITPCGGDLCGFIMGIALDHPQDPMPKTWKGDSQCGFLMFRASPTDPDGQGNPQWKGVLQDPRDGKVYRLIIKFDAQGNLYLHGYVGLPMLGETQLWPRFTGQVLPGCRVPALDGS
ncbi:DUF2147 domain-containing protein [Acidocella sp.]|uniref:DUF2147 domain-containing protein n=1 Tax=Acidocella sp. TaxID=50710 RepID=UPI003449BBA6